MHLNVRVVLASVDGYVLELITSRMRIPRPICKQWWRCVAGVRRVWGRPMEFAREVLPEADLARVTELSALIVSAVGKIMESDSNKNSDAAPPAS